MVIGFVSGIFYAYVKKIANVWNKCFPEQFMNILKLQWNLLLKQQFTIHTSILNLL